MQESEPISNPAQASNSPATETSASQKPAVNRPVFIWFLVILVVLLLGTTGVFAYKYYEIKQQVDNKETIPSAIPTKSVTTSPTPMESIAPIATPAAKWKTYTNENEIFTIKYPSDWDFEITSPMTISTDPNTNERVYFGIVKFSGPQGYFSITYGDGFGGGSCSAFGGNLETFTINQKNVNLCYRLLENNTHYWGGVGDTEVVRLDSSELTSYNFAAELNLSHSDSYSFLSQILSTFKSP